VHSALANISFVELVVLTSSVATTRKHVITTLMKRVVVIVGLFSEYRVQNNMSTHNYVL